MLYAEILHTKNQYTKSSIDHLYRELDQRQSDAFINLKQPSPLTKQGNGGAPTAPTGVVLVIVWGVRVRQRECTPVNPQT